MPYPWESSNYKTYPPRGISSNGNDIVENPDTNPVLIGHTLQYCVDLENALNEALTKAEGYFNELVDAGLRERPRSAEDMLLDTMAAIKQLSDKIDRLEGAGTNGQYDAKSDRTGKRDKPAIGSTGAEGIAQI